MFLVFGLSVKAQVYGNEWINFNLEYYKIETAEDGVYVLDETYFTNSGIDLSAIDPQTLHLFHRGEEVAILVEGESDGSFDVTDRLLFLGKENDGVLDSSLYLQGMQPHQYYSLMNDTTAYFLTWDATQGKRMSLSDLNSTGNAETAHGVEKLNVFYDRYSFGEEHLAYVFYSEFDRGEGWFSQVRTTGGSLSYTFTDLNEVQGDSIELEVMLVGANRYEHNCQLQIGSSTIQIESFESYNSHVQSIKVASSEIVSGSLIIQLNVIGTENADAVSIAYYKLNYESTADVTVATEYNFKTSGIGVLDAKLGGASDGYLFDCTDEQNLVQITLNPNGADLDYVYDANRKMIYSSETSLLIPVLATVVSFNDDLSSDAEFLLISHTKFMSGCAEYKTYRESIEGGGMNVLLADVNRLYNQYGYGEKSPLAIRNLVHYLYQQGSARYLFLVGTGRAISYQNGSKPYNRHLEFNNTYYGSQNYVPTLGNPGSDILYSTGLMSNVYEPALATGRMSIWEDAQMKIYLDKVKEHESQTDVAYRKRGLHLSGGETAGEQAQFQSYMEGYESNFNSPNLGGEITLYSKSGGAGIEFFNVSKEINDGVSIVNSFSHSSSQVTEIDIGEVSNEVTGYENKGKYPLIMVNGCHAGDAYNLTNDADDWLFSTADKGAIGWLAHSSYGYASYLNSYAQLFYYHLYNNDSLWTAPLGDIQNATIVDFMNKPGYTSSSSALTHYLQFQLQGDPFVSMFPHTEADFEVSGAYISAYDNDPISAASDSLVLSVIINNRARAISDSIELCVNRVYEGGEFTYESVRIKSPYNQDTVVLRLPNINSAFGLNQFEITVNCMFDVAEVDSLNNEFELSFFFTENVALPLIPSEFSIVNDTLVTFISQSASQSLDTPIIYFFEIDTTVSFDMPLAQQTIEAYNYPEVRDFELPIKVDSTVYYWRIGLVSDLDTVWSVSSFSYIKTREGFSQTNIDQFYKGEFNNISRVLDLKSWAYDSVFTEVNAQSGGADLERYWEESWISVDGQSIVLQGWRGGCTNSGVFLLTFDQVTGLPYNINGINNGSCGNRPRMAESFKNLNQVAFQGYLQSYIENTVDGDYILIVGVGEAYFESWGVDLKNAVEGIGAQLLDQLVSGEPYVLLGKKGSAQLEFEERGTSATEIIEMLHDLSGQFDGAKITSPNIGPALAWDTFYRRVDSTQSDTYSFEIVGVTSDGLDVSLFSVIGNELDSLDLSSIDASEYPFLKLVTDVIDTLNLTPPQLKNWGVTYEPSPEGLILYSQIDERFKNQNEYVLGDSDTLGIWFENITFAGFNDSIDVVSTIYNLEQGTLVTDTLTVWGPNALDSIYLEIPIAGDLGLNNFSVYVNFQGVQEQSYSNNYFDGEFVVSPDFDQFIMDVTFDGVHIKNGDVVAKYPEIEIGVFNDYARYPITDTSSVKMYLLDLSCTSCVGERIYFSDESVSWTENISSSGISIQYLPTHLVDNSYELILINASDVTKTYEIQFTVKGTFSISTIELYPNPSSGDVYIEFDLTGETLPDVLTLKMYSYKGEFVSTLNKSDLDYLHVGHNVLKISTNSFPSGLFIYHFEVEDNGATNVQRGKFVKL